MHYSLARASLPLQRTGCIVAGVYEGGELAVGARELDAACGGALQRRIGGGDMDGRAGRSLLLHELAGIAGERVLLVGLGPSRAFNETAYRKALRCAVKALRETGTTHATFDLPSLPVGDRPPDWRLEQALLAIEDGCYRFDRLKAEAARERPALQAVAFQVPPALGPEDRRAMEDAMHRAQAIAAGISLARDLGNLPGNLCTPTYLARQAIAMGQGHGLRVQVLEYQAIARLGMNGLLAVARGSQEPPRLVVMAHEGGGRDAPPVVLVGKGITFDAGGISIKPAPHMDEMKFDMCGAASVFGTLRAVAQMRLPINVVGIVPATENMPDGNATRPGDVITTMSGQTVEILDTDSEGRLILCDALTYAERFRPAAVIDIATLTAEIVSALGEVASGLFSTSDVLAHELLQAGDAAWDRAWRMPLWDDYADTLVSNFADLPNIGSGTDCAVTAASFLSNFTRSYPWAHLDIAGTASLSGPDKGATGRPVALLSHFLARRALAAPPMRTR